MLATVRKLRFKAILLGFKQHEFAGTSRKKYLNLIISLQQAPHEFWIKKQTQTNTPQTPHWFLAGNHNEYIEKNTKPYNQCSCIFLFLWFSEEKMALHSLLHPSERVHISCFYKCAHNQWVSKKISQQSLINIKRKRSGF